MTGLSQVLPVNLAADDNEQSATLVEIREPNLSDAGSIPAIST